MISRHLRNKKGFTLVEIMIVVIIIGILIAIAVPKFVQITTAAEQSVLKYNSTYIVKVFALNIYKYKSEDGYSDEDLKDFLKNELEGSQVNSNEDSIKNPGSRSMKILQGNNPAEKNPAVFITGNSTYTYSNTVPSADLFGSIVVYISNVKVQVYYIDTKGIISEIVANFK